MNMPLVHSPVTAGFGSRRNIALVVGLTVLVMVTVRAAGEQSMMGEFGSDPQMPIWIMFMVVKLVLWLTIGIILAGLVVFFRQRRWAFRCVLVFFCGWAVAIGWASLNYLSARRALADAGASSTSSERLLELADFNGIQAGYELDNRLAIHPHAPPELLLKLYHRRNQGTLMVLARNPHTPAEVLQKLVENEAHDEWVRKSLKQNPSLSSALRQQLDEVETPTTK